MKKTTMITAALLVAALGTTATIAQAKGPRGGPHIDLTQMDLDGNGAITKDEITAFNETRFTEADADGNGSLSQEEALSAMSAHFDGDVPARFEERFSRMFSRMDADDSGGLTLQEQFPEDRTARMFDRLDADEDGTLSAEELEQAKSHRGDRGKGKGKGKGHGRGDRAASDKS